MITQQFQLLVTVYASSSGLSVSQQVIPFSSRQDANNAFETIKASDVAKTLGMNAKREVLKLYTEERQY